MEREYVNFSPNLNPIISQAQSLVSLKSANHILWAMIIW